METTVATGTGALCVLELGTNSLKLHVFTDDLGRFEPYRVEWDVGYEVCSTRRISDESIESTLNQVQTLLGEHRGDPSKVPVFGIATGAFRDAENTSALFGRLDRDLGVPVRILDADEEAGLLIERASRLVPERPGMAFDLGGGSLEMVYFGVNGTWLREALPLGAIRVHHVASFISGSWDEPIAKQWVEKGLQKARRFKLPVIHGTGGTVKALSQVVGTTAIPAAEVRRIEEATRRSGPPPGLTRRRCEIFLPGLLVVSSLLEHFESEMLHYTRIDLGEVLLARLLPFREALRGPMGLRFFLHGLDVFRAQ